MSKTNSISQLHYELRPRKFKLETERRLARLYRFLKWYFETPADKRSWSQCHDIMYLLFQCSCLFWGKSFDDNTKKV